jgi:hypothetical protein
MIPESKRHFALLPPARENVFDLPAANGTILF